MDFHNALKKILGNDKSIKEVHIDYRVIDEIVKIAVNADPKEYVALLSGDIEKEILKIKGLIFLPFKASGTSAVMEVFMMPMTTKAVGSVHSHPGPSASPSQADLTFFSKNGYFHMIICRPYSQSTIKAYDHFGNPLTFEVKDLGDEVDIKQWEDLDISEEYFDEEFIKEMKALEEEDDEVFDETNENDQVIDENIVEENDEIINEIKDIKENDKNILNNNNFEEEKKLSNDQNNENQNNEQKQKHATLNLEFEIKGKKYVEAIPLPPEYEPGDQIDVDIRTDKTPNDNIDEIVVNVKKVPKNKANSKVITVTPQKLSSKSIQNNDVKVEQVNTEKTSEEIEQEIREMEKDIAKLKEENERLKNNL